MTIELGTNTGHTIFMAPTRTGKGLGILLSRQMLENAVFFDPKGSAFVMSKAKAKKRLKAAGLRPSEANALVQEIAGQFHQGRTLRDAMRHKKRKAKKWFPWDAVVQRA